MTRGKTSLLASVLLIGAFSLFGCGGKGNNSDPPGAIVGNTVSLSGSEEVPPSSTGASGSGTLEVNAKTGAISGHLTMVTAPTSTVIAVHVQEGARGVNGCIVMILENAGGGVWNVPAGTVMHQSGVDAFTAGNLYFNVRTVVNPLGELRGQIGDRQ